MPEIINIISYIIASLFCIGFVFITIKYFLKEVRKNHKINIDFEKWQETPKISTKNNGITLSEYSEKLKFKSEFFKKNDLMDFYKDINPDESIEVWVSGDSAFNLNPEAFDMLVLPKDRKPNKSIESYFFFNRLKEHIGRSYLKEII